MALNPLLKGLLQKTNQGFQAADDFLGSRGGNFALNLLAQQGFSTMPQSPFAAIGRAGIATQQQEQEAGMNDAQRRLIESQIGLNQAQIAGGGANNNVQSTFQGQNGNMWIVRRGGGPPEDTGVPYRQALQFFRGPDGSVTGVNTLTGANVGQPISSEEAADLARRAAESEAQTEASMSLQDQELRAQTTLDLLDQIENHPGLSAAVGAKGLSSGFGFFNQPIAGTDAADFVALLEQVSGTAFLEAFQMLKGGGQITEIESQKAEQAITRLGNRNQSEEAYRRAIAAFRQAIQDGLAKLRNQASGDFTTVPGGDDLTPEEQAELEDLRRASRN